MWGEEIRGGGKKDNAEKVRGRKKEREGKETIQEEKVKKPRRRRKEGEEEMDERN